MAYPSADSRYRERRGTANSSNPVAMLERRSTSNSVLDGGGLKEKILGYVKSGCKTLDLSSRGIITLPPEISLLSNLTRLYLDHNQLEALPPEFSALISLEELDLSHNQLKAFPREIFNLTNLKKLRLSYNNISKFSSGIKKLTKLRVLNLFQNELTYIPQELREMTHIQELYIGNNGFNLSNFPEASEAKVCRLHSWIIRGLQARYYQKFVNILFRELEDY
jgi:Leucine-rich repeat (LRR) protein